MLQSQLEIERYNKIEALTKQAEFLEKNSKYVTYCSLLIEITKENTKEKRHIINQR